MLEREGLGGASPRPMAGRAVGAAETLVGAGVLAALAGVAAGVLWAQAEAGRRATAAATADPAAGCSALALDPVAGLVPASEVQTWGAARLAERIDGKADAYLSAGFRCLTTRSFSVPESPGDFVEVFAYDMLEAEGAFSVWSTQRRPGAVDPGLKDGCYQAVNGVFCARGATYLEVVASAPRAPVIAPALALAAGLLAGLPDAAPPAAPSALLPAAGLEAGSQARITGDAFGVPGLDGVLTARYRVGDATLLAFVAAGDSERQASERADAFARFLASAGGVAEDADGIPGGQVFLVLGATSVVFTRGPVVAGVHEAPTREAALELARELLGALETRP